ncbi:MAG: carboxylase [Bacteroidales bacterium]
MHKKSILIRDLTLRDGQQSLFATRMNQSQVDRVLPLFNEANFYAMEIWGGAVPDSVMRYLNESPWTRLNKINDAIDEKTKLTALSRGRNLFGYSPYPDSVIEGFCKLSIENGISIMRIFDALNDFNNVKSTIEYVKKYNAIADCALVYTVDSKQSKKNKLKYLFKPSSKPQKVFTLDYFLAKAKELELMGADIITIKDMAGLIKPEIAGKLVKVLKDNVDVPIDLHTHCTPGYGVASALMAIVNGVDIVDTAIGCFAGGTSNPPFEIVQIFCNKLGIDTNVNLEAITKIAPILREIRTELKDFDNYEKFPREFNLLSDKLPAEIDALFDKAIEEAKKDDAESLLETCHKIEHWFGYPPADEKIKQAEIPGGMYSNMIAQVKQLKMEDKLDRAIELIPKVRTDAGSPPLVTPTSQIVGVQAVNCAIDETKKNPEYTTKSVQFINLVKGGYGATPVPINEQFRYKIAGVYKEEGYDPSTYTKQPNPTFPEFNNAVLAADLKEELLLELFPQVAYNFLYSGIKKKHEEKIENELRAKQEKFLEEKRKYEELSAEEKQERLLQGLYNYDWATGFE